MKKLLLIFCLSFSFCANGQSFKTLKIQADSLQKIDKNKKAQKLYSKAIMLVLNYKERVTDEQWMGISVAAHANDFHITNKKGKSFICYEYGNDGPILKEKINALSAQGVKCLFTYREWLGMTGPSIIVYPDPSSGGNVGLYENARTLLVWATEKDVYFQGFNSSNIYKPLIIHNDTLRDILKNHGDEMLHQSLKDEHYKHSESPLFIFDFHFGKELWTRRLYDPTYLKNPEANSKAYLSKVLPLMWQESKSYYTRAKTE